MKKIRQGINVLLIIAMILSLGSFSVASAESADVQSDTSDISAQLNLIFSSIGNLKQDDSQFKWYYSVMDLNHNGQLEFVAAAQHPADRSTNLRVWEVGTDRTGLTEYQLEKDPEESFPDILTDTADTYHDTQADTWSYMFYDNIVISPTEVYTVKCSVHIKDGVIGYDSYAVEHTELVNGYRNVSHTDNMGFPISPDVYNASGYSAFATAERSSTNFDWFTAEEAANLARLTDSYMVFAGQKEPTEVFPVPKPEALQETPATPTPTQETVPAPVIVTPVPTPTPTPQPAFLMITKNPTNENKKEGGTACFVACSNVYESLDWTMVSPDGGEYYVQSFQQLYPSASISGEYSTTLNVGNVSSDMSGWGAYCTFYYKGQTARTSTAYISVSGGSTPQPVVPTPPQTGSFSGYVADYDYDTVSLYLYDGMGYTTTVGRDICGISGEIYVGAPCVAYYDGIGAHGAIFTYVDITGSTPQPQPSYGSMGGTAYHDTAFTVYLVLQDGTSVTVDGYLCNVVYGDFEDGCSCTAYYTDYPSEGNIYQVDIYGVESDYYEPDPYWDDVAVDIGDAVSFDPYDDPNYDPIGDEHHRVTCPNCGNHFSPGEIACPVCGWTGD